MVSTKYPPRLIPKPGYQVHVNKLAGRNFLVTASNPLNLAPFSDEEIDECISLQLILEQGLLLPDYGETATPSPPSPPIPIPTLKPAAEDRVVARIKADVEKVTGRGEAAVIDVSGVAEKIPEIAEKRAAAQARQAEERERLTGVGVEMTKDELMEKAREERPELKPASGVDKFPVSGRKPPKAKAKKIATKPKKKVTPKKSTKKKTAAKRKHASAKKRSTSKKK